MRRAVTAYASSLRTTRIGGPSRTSCAPTNRIERYTGKQVLKRFRFLSL